MMAGLTRVPGPEPRDRTVEQGAGAMLSRFEMPREGELDATPEIDPTTIDTSAPDVDTSTGDATRAAQDLVAATLVQFEPPVVQPITPMPETVSLTTPIEQAVHQLLDQIQTFAQAANDEVAPIALDEIDDDEESLEVSLSPDAIAVAPDAPQKPDHNAAPRGPTATVAVREPAPLPENPNPSHVHLVLDDGPARVVVTVAVRGSEVNVGLRGGDDQTAASLARNAASLDHAMRARGLDLTSFTSERELGHDHRDREAPAPHEREETEQFRLEEIA